MNGPHDLGGSHGFGRVPVEDRVPFHDEWEKRTFAILVTMGITRGMPRTLDASRFAIESLPPEVYLDAAYFERWLLAGERVCEAHGAFTAEELDRSRRRLAADREPPHGDHGDKEQRERVVAALHTGVSHGESSTPSRDAR